MAETAWSILPPLITIALALVTKEVYMSLLVGIFSGALLYTGFDVIASIVTMFEVMADKVGGNVNILIFLVILGIIVAAITRSGATRAYGEWAASKIQGPRSAMLLTALLGAVIFIDDYFNCLTVGTVMRPITDKFKISRAKLAYIIDATAAPVCILAPVSSWAAAVGSSLPEDCDIDGFSLFLQTIPFNLYAILAMCFMLFVVLSRRDVFTMATYVRNFHEHYNVPTEYRDSEEPTPIEGHGKVMDLVLPLAVLISACVYGMLYTGGIQEGATISEAFADCDASKGLVIGSFIAFVFTALLYLPRKVITFTSFCETFVQGFKAMTPANLILCFAWTLSGICSDKYLNLGGYVGGIVSANTDVIMFLPAIFFIVAILLAFATGTSWGTFGILIPIAVAVVGVEDVSMLSICVAACLSGAVGGDHASPISDTTILASAGAQCSHIDHVSTQIPYVGIVAGASFVGYLVDGLTGNGWAGLITASFILALVMIGIYTTVRPNGRK